MVSYLSENTYKNHHSKCKVINFNSTKTVDLYNLSWYVIPVLRFRLIPCYIPFVSFRT